MLLQQEKVHLVKRGECPRSSPAGTIILLTPKRYCVYGTYDYTLSYDDGTLRMRVTKKGELFIYRREVYGEEFERVLPGKGASITIHPVEPLAVPKQISRFLEIAFNPVIVGPKSSTMIFLTFPIDIGIFLKVGGATEVLDIFTLNPTKYSLYGTPKAGVITRWHHSDVWSDLPPTDPLRTGTLKLSIKNDTDEIVTVSRAVFEGHGMVLYYGDFVGMTAQMTIMSSVVAETTFTDVPMVPGMVRAIELLKAKKIPMIGVHKITGVSGVELNVFLMEWGLS